MNVILKEVTGASCADPLTRWVDVDPNMAAEWLKRNSHNRPKKMQSIARYAEDMAAGNWKVTGSPIQFGASGQLVDGQNRLQAIIDSGATIRVLVVEGVDDEVFDVIDGNAKRTGSDMLHIEGHEGWLASCGARASQIAASLMAGQRPYSLTLSAPKIRRFVIANPALMDSVRFVSELPRKSAPLVHSAGAALHFLMSKKDVALADKFMRRLYTGEDMGAGDTLLSLRNTLIGRAMDKAHGKGDSAATVGAVIRVWNSTRAGRSIRYIQNAFPGSNDAFPEIK